MIFFETTVAGVDFLVVGEAGVIFSRLINDEEFLVSADN